MGPCTRLVQPTVGGHLDSGPVRDCEVHMRMSLRGAGRTTYSTEPQACGPPGNSRSDVFGNKVRRTRRCGQRASALRGR